MNRMDRSVLHGGTPVELTVKEFALLEFLLQRREGCCSRGDLLREVWQMPEDAGTNVVDVYVNYLRKKLAAALPEKAEESAIETVRGAGYKLRAVRKPPARVGMEALPLARGA